MSLDYEDIKDKEVVIVDSREKDRAKRFKRYLDSYLEKKSNSKLEVMDVLKNKRKNEDEYFKIDNLEYGDYAFREVVVEFKNYEDFKTSLRDGKLTTQVENLYAHSGFKDIALIVICDNPVHFMNENSQWKGILRFNSKINIFLAKDENMAFEAICHFFWLNGRHLTQPPRSKMKKNDNYAVNLLWATRTLSDKQIREIIKKTKINTIPQAIQLFTENDSQELCDKLNINRLTVKKIEECKSVLNGEPLI
ncbi:ERCC4 domain-containing protein [uncultured Methanobrevibacter sp.]|uniref:ERCC4 domain-containing protein n=1 Tax=uncultured Methanobrevibacter sp. TaxID=253161 RepID=UPI0025EB9088|nr:ERCC4 domain-containing protein [uncultured Methanobrevibacter sp.]